MFIAVALSIAPASGRATSRVRPVAASQCLDDADKRLARRPRSRRSRSPRRERPAPAGSRPRPSAGRAHADRTAGPRRAAPHVAPWPHCTSSAKISSSGLLFMAPPSERSSARRHHAAVGLLRVRADDDLALEDARRLVVDHRLEQLAALAMRHRMVDDERRVGMLAAAEHGGAVDLRLASARRRSSRRPDGATVAAPATTLKELNGLARRASRQGSTAPAPRRPRR